MTPARIAIAGGTALALLAAGAGLAAKPETPRDVYDRTEMCAAIASAAQVHTAAESTPKELDDARKLSEMTIQDADAAGAKLGKSREQVASDVTGIRVDLLRDLNSPDKAKAKKEEGELGHMLLACAFTKAKSAM